MRARLRAYGPELAIGLAAVLYGSTFTIVQDALHDMSAVGFNARDSRSVPSPSRLTRARGSSSPPSSWPGWARTPP